MPSASSQTSPVRAQTSLIERFGGDGKAMVANYNPSLNGRYVADVKRCYFGTAPTIEEIVSTYGKEVAQYWWVGQLHYLNTTSGASRKMTSAEMASTAELLVFAHPDIKITEGILFVEFFKTGRLKERFYGSIDGDIILRAFNSFESFRIRAMEDKEAEDRLEERERWRAEAVTYEQYLQTKNKQ